MGEERHEELTEEELEGTDGEPLPDREEMSPVPVDPIGGGITLPIEPPATE